jgi:hypothetical protein
MTNAMATTVTRRVWLARLLMAAAVAPVVGVPLAETVEADKKKRPSQKKRIGYARESCEAGGGTLVEQTHDSGGTTTECKGGTFDGTFCFHGAKKTKCHSAAPNLPNAGGGGAVPPSGGNEDPTDGGGSNPGGGSHVPPSGGVDPDGGGSDPVLE